MHHAVLYGLRQYQLGMWSMIDGWLNDCLHLDLLNRRWVRPHRRRRRSHRLHRHGLYSVVGWVDRKKGERYDKFMLIIIIEKGNFDYFFWYVAEGIFIEYWAIFSSLLADRIWIWRMHKFMADISKWMNYYWPFIIRLTGNDFYWDRNNRLVTLRAAFFLHLRSVISADHMEPFGWW